jgi:tetratricopeptide (TPR) repeat protein
MRNGAGLILLCSCLGVAFTARAQDEGRETTRDVELGPDEEEARAHFRLAQLQYRRGRFAEAAREFEQAHALVPRAELLYNVYLAWRDAGEPEPAARALRELLEGELPAPLGRERLEASLASLERSIAERRELEERLAAQEARAQASATPPREPGPEPPPEGGAGGGTWTPGWAILAAGGALVVAGAITGGVALGLYDDVTSRCSGTICPADTEGDRASGQALTVTTDVLLPVGVAAAATGLLLALLIDGSEGSERLTAGCTLDGCGVSLRGSF